MRPSSQISLVQHSAGAVFEDIPLHHQTSSSSLPTYESAVSSEPRRPSKAFTKPKKLTQNSEIQLSSAHAAIFQRPRSCLKVSLCLTARLGKEPRQLGRGCMKITFSVRLSKTVIFLGTSTSLISSLQNGTRLLVGIRSGDFLFWKTSILRWVILVFTTYQVYLLTQLSGCILYFVHISAHHLTFCDLS